MQFLVWLAVEHDVDHHRLESTWYGRGRAQDFADKVKRAGIAARRNRADVPDDWLFGIQICGADQKQPALFVFPRDCCQHRCVEVMGYQIEKRRRVSKRIAENAADDTSAFRDIVGRGRRVNVAKLPVIIGPKECEWR